MVSDITETEAESLFRTYISPLPASYIVAAGLDPTVVVATTLLVESEMTETVPETEFAT